MTKSALYAVPGSSARGMAAGRISLSFGGPR